MTMKIYVVGGAVRDELLGLLPKDFDYVVVDGSVQEMLDLGFKQVGADFPVFLHPETGAEYALARTERKTGSGYGGFTVVTEGVTLEEDLSRRDLTINAMARPIEGGDIIDPFNGQLDLKLGILRHVSPAFSEDPLRVLRIARFFARYDNFVIAQSTKNLCMRLVGEGALNELSIERFWQELKKVFEEKRPDNFFDMIRHFGGDVHIKFFNELYGTLTLDKLNLIKRYALEVKRLTAEDQLASKQLMVHTALTAKPSSPTMESADSATKTLYKNIDIWRGTSTTDYGIFNLLTQTKAFAKDNQSINHLLNAISVAEAVGQGGAVRIGMLYAAYVAANRVTSANFPDVQGKALGEAIALGRRKAIADSL